MPIIREFSLIECSNTLHQGYQILAGDLPHLLCRI